MADTGGWEKHQNDGISMTTPADAPKQHNTYFDKAYNQHLFGFILAVLLRQGYKLLNVVYYNCSSELAFSDVCKILIGFLAFPHDFNRANNQESLLTTV